MMLTTRSTSVIRRALACAAVAATTASPAAWAQTYQNGEGGASSPPQTMSAPIDQGTNSSSSMRGTMQGNGAMNHGGATGMPGANPNGSAGNGAGNGHSDGAGGSGAGGAGNGGSSGY